jgi:hypothetical protein
MASPRKCQEDEMAPQYQVMIWINRTPQGMMTASNEENVWEFIPTFTTAVNDNHDIFNHCK